MSSSNAAPPTTLDLSQLSPESVQKLRDQLLAEIKPTIDAIRTQANRAIAATDAEFTEQLTAAPKSYPAGFRVDRPVSREEHLYAKLAVLAAQRGGVWSPNPAERRYKACDHVGECPDCLQAFLLQQETEGDEAAGEYPEIGKLPCAQHKRPAAQCDLCWTKTTEQRHLFALGLGRKPRLPLTLPEARGSQRARDLTSDEQDARQGLVTAAA